MMRKTRESEVVRYVVQVVMPDLPVIPTRAQNGAQSVIYRTIARCKEVYGLVHGGNGIQRLVSRNRADVVDSFCDALEVSF